MATQWLRFQRFLVGAFAVASVAGVAQAQGSSAGARGVIVTGTVADPGGTPIPDADVAVLAGDSATRTVQSDAKGNFRLEDIATAPVVLRVTRVGFADRKISVDNATVARTTNVFVTLQPTVAALAAAEAAAASDDDEAEDVRLVEFRERMRTNKFARFYDEKAIVKSHATYLSELLRGVPGFMLSQSTRIGNEIRVRTCTVNTPTHTGPLVFVDGVRMAGTELDEAARITDAIAMEAYASSAGIPPAFFDRSAGCGTILVWTKNR